MSRKKKKNGDEAHVESDLSILEAVENLSNIAEMDSSERIGVVEDHLIVHGSEEDEHTPLEAISWLEEKSQHKTEAVVEDTFKAVLKYVKDFHHKEFNRFYEEKNQEGIKKIMFLVGKASDKLKKFTHLFTGESQKGIEDTKEYQQLTNFYKERIAVEDDEKVSLIDLSRKGKEGGAKAHPIDEEDEDFIKAKQFILDIEKIKNDENYELLFIQKDDGSRFYNQDFYRNLKVACNFGEYVGKHVERDPIEGLKCWFDRSLQISSKKILLLIGPHLKQFYQEALKYKDMEIVSCVNMATMALMMAANPKNIKEVQSFKSSGEYFLDFQWYLRASLASFEYQKLKSFPPPSSNIFLHTLMDIIHLMSWALFFHSLDLNSLGLVIDDMSEEGRLSVSKKGSSKKQAGFWEELEENYLALSRYLLNYPVGPLFNALTQFQEGNLDGFDSLLTKNIPMEWQCFEINQKPVSLLRLPSPTKQELITKVSIDQEFIGLLDAFKLSKNSKKHLLINLQNRTIWKEHPRAKELESLSKKADVCEYIDVVTLSVDSDFYSQTGAYKDLNSIAHFFKQIIFQLHSQESGFYFPGWIEEKIFSGFIEKLIQQIHRFFFDSKSKLDQKERQDFIEILYQFLTLKLIEVTEPTSLSLTCKDGIDSGGIAMCEFYCFLKAIQGEKLKKEDLQKLNMLLFSFPMLMRQRCIQAERFNRFIQCQKRIQRGMEKHGLNKSKQSIEKYFGSLFKMPLDQIKFRSNIINQMGDNFKN